MISTKLRLIYFLLFMFVIQTAHSQYKFGIGSSGIYKTQTGTFGAGARLFIPVHEKLVAVPYGYYYFKNNELSGGISALIPFNESRYFTFYTIVAGTFKGSAKVSLSVNNSSQSASESKSYKADGEAGLGVLIGPGCLKGFIEPRYAVSEKQVLIRVGAAYFFQCERSHGHKRHKRSKSHKRATKHKNTYKRGKSSACPAYN